VLFADVRGSTSLGERAEPADFAALMNRFYRTATATLVAHDAVIDKLIGDEVMALFIRGVAGPEYRQRSVDAGAALLRAVGYGSGTDPWLAIGVGVHAGTAFVGNVGGNGVVDFTALGDVVNVAARLQAVAAPGEMVVGAGIHDGFAGFGAGERRSVELRGHDEAVAVVAHRA
jgi:adenylate cyclase